MTLQGLLLLLTFAGSTDTMDDANWDVFKMSFELGPEGNVEDEFRSLYGFDFHQQSLTHPFSRDITTIFTNLFVVDNNGPDSIGGGGEPGVPLAPGFLPSDNLTVTTTMDRDWNLYASFDTLETRFRHPERHITDCNFSMTIDLNSGWLRFMFTGENPGSTIRILDMAGREIASSGRSFEKVVHISLSGLPPGIYLALVQHDPFTLEVKKFVIPD
jgi:hypothetical protein